MPVPWFHFFAQNGRLYVFHSSHTESCEDDHIVMLQSQLWIEFVVEITRVLFSEDILDFSDEKYISDCDKSKAMADWDQMI